MQASLGKKKRKKQVRKAEVFSKILVKLEKWSKWYKGKRAKGEEISYDLKKIENFYRLAR